MDAQEMLETYTMQEIINSESEYQITQCCLHIHKLFENVQNGTFGAFDLIVKFADVQKYLQVHSNKIAFKYQNNISCEDIESEFILEMFNHLRKRYRMKYDVNEIKTFLQSLNKWIDAEINRKVAIQTRPKRDEEFQHYYVIDSKNEIDDFVFLDSILGVLSGTEIEIFDLYFQQGYTIREVARIIRKPKTNVWEDVKRIKDKLKEELQ